MKKMDWFIPGAAILVALIWYFVLIFASAPGREVVVTVDGEVYGTYSLDEDREILIPGARGMNNRLRIQGGRADIIDADCPDKLCVHQKAISRTGETLVCLPNRVVVEVKGEAESESGVDAVAQ
ncbi:MAG: NusG domain II-containing protein [Lachnospiraceae bacterium]|nr:NusG domain II-containing protein [Lachnospiraceae bacterium]